MNFYSTWVGFDSDNPKKIASSNLEGWNKIVDDKTKVENHTASSQNQ